MKATPVTASGKDSCAMKKLAVLVKDPEVQYEGLRVSLGALLDDVAVEMFVLNHEVSPMDEAYSENMEFLDEMEGLRFSNNSANVEKYGFAYLSRKAMTERLKAADVVIPF